VQRRAIEVLTLRRDYIMIVDSGTAGKLLGKVGMTTTMHDGCVGNNNMIRVIIDDPLRRDYVYYFLRSELGQALLLRNVYGTNQDHIEPEDVTLLPIPLPRSLTRLQHFATQVREIIDLRERASQIDGNVSRELSALLRQAFEGMDIEMPTTPAIDSE
jgi:type I restriction enzyme M protein